MFSFRDFKSKNEQFKFKPLSPGFYEKKPMTTITVFTAQCILNIIEILRAIN